MSTWLLEHDNEGEVYTRPHCDEALIQEVLSSFNGSSIFYCCLSDKTDESFLCCMGEPDRRIIEGRVFEDDTMFDFALRKRPGENGGNVSVRYGMQPDELAEVESSEILTATEALAVFHSFFGSKKIPDDFVPISKSRLLALPSVND